MIDDDKANMAIAKALTASPIAAVLPAEPGWRAVVAVDVPGDPTVHQIVTRPIAFWSVEPTMMFPTPISFAAETATDRLLMALAGMGQMPNREEPAFRMWPLDDARKRFDAARTYAWFGPDVDDAEAIRRVVEWIKARTAKDAERAARSKK